MSVAQLETWKLAHAYSRIGSGTTPTTSQDIYYTEPTDEDGVPWITTAELRENYIENTSSRITKEALKDFSTLRVYQSGSLFIAMYGATIGRLGISQVPATCNQACCVLEKSAQFDNRFLFYWLWHRRADLVALSTGGGQPNLSQQDIREERALCPPLETQQRIARFLDEKTARIDGLIEKKRALLDRLAEQRQALITRAVTKGLKPDAPMKPSGIDWLGDIPAHWEMKRLRFLLNGGTLNGLYKSKEEFDPEGVPFVQMGEAFRSPVFSGGTEDRVVTSDEEKGKWGLRDGDFLIARRSIVFEGSGKSAMVVGVQEPHLFESSMIRIRPSNPSDHSAFLSHFFQSCAGRASFLAVTKRVTISGIDSQQLKSVHIPVPPGSEAREIAAICETHERDAERVEREISTSIAQLAEYRSALITAAVTGQVADLA
ncbi:restriction endonuclease subunit S [Rhizobium leguminosarum]|uniref:restriction endonuclease subunit S n=1 Tax=Rhizobium leguminosarum TaxID=384 RepID=UPI0013BC73A2|nr:restriction endonuclease subunit S [Rhizobium leguminosarum]NEI57971.1 restriction endonuclease subunit S [Rhizobium leguminosarum]NEI83301.1 restriction endonuclease subunit S [Rhizobium leguminosarum]